MLKRTCGLLLAFAFVASAALADEFTVVPVAKPAATLITIINTTGHLLAVEGSNNDKTWTELLYNFEPDSGTWVEIPGASFTFYRLVELPKNIVVATIRLKPKK